MGSLLEDCKYKNYFFFLISFLIFVGSVNAATVVYDDFSGTTLNLDKWVESTDLENWPLFDEHYLDTNEQAYHTAQLTAGNKVILLNLTRNFYPGEILEYDVNYVSGSGNILSRPTIDDTPLDLMLGNVCNGYATCGNIGFWDGDSTVGNVNGLYHVKVEFLDDSVTVTFTNPNN